jgi:hydroxyacylglutathione hydrolase
MKVEQIFFKNTLRNFSYLITFSDDVIYCIDPFSAAEVQKHLDQSGKGKLKAILNTHDHCDHHSGNAELLAIHQCEVLCHYQAKVPEKTRGLLNHEIVHACGEWKLECVYTPGHTATHVGFILKKEKKPFAFFTGDCFFNAGVGHCRNGDPTVMFHTIDNIFSTLPDDLIIYPGHEYLKRNLEFTLSVEQENEKALSFLNALQGINLDEKFFLNSMKTEREINTFLRLEEKTVVKNLHLPHNDKKAVFLKLRQLRDQW